MGDEMDWKVLWDNTKDFVNQEFLGNSCGKWLLLLLAIFVSLLVGKILSAVFIRQAKLLRSKKHFTTMAIFFEAMSKPAMLFVFSAGLMLGGAPIKMEGNLKPGFYDKAALLLLSISIVWFAFLLVNVIDHMLAKLSRKTDSLLDDQIVQVIRKSLRIFIIIVGVMYIMSAVFDRNIGTLLAGMGIGGLAFALASKDMLSNLFGSVTIFFDKPFKLGDRVKIGSHDGVVEDIGFRSTRIRTENGHFVSIPNQNMTNDAVENVTSRPFIMREFAIGVEYSTSPEKLRRAVEIVREMLESRKSSFPADKPGRAYFTELSASSLDIGVTYWYKPAVWNEYMNFSHDFNMELFERFNKEGIAFAFPTQTLYLRNESKECTNV
jgi:MscS family membrane protein